MTCMETNPNPYHQYRLYAILTDLDTIQTTVSEGSFFTAVDSDFGDVL